MAGSPCLHPPTLPRHPRIMLRRFSLSALLLAPALLLLLAGCPNPAPQTNGPKAAATKTYSVRGYVVRLDPTNHTAVLKHEKIEGWMEAMTMEFPVKDPAEFAKLAIGDHIECSLSVSDAEYFLIGIRITGKTQAK